MSTVPVTPQSVNDQVTKINTDIQSIRDFVKANPAGGATQAQLETISSNLTVAQTNLDLLKQDLGMPAPTPAPTPTK